MRRQAPGEFAPSTIDLLKTFAAQSVLAIHNARLFTKIENKSRQLELANTAKSRFLAMASHDLRQPLHALGLFIAHLRTPLKPREREKTVERVDAAVNARIIAFIRVHSPTHDAALLPPLHSCHATASPVALPDTPSDAVHQCIRTTPSNS